MIVLLLGSGGREHALAATLAKSPKLTRLIAAPGNPGIAQHAELRDVPVDDLDGIVRLATTEKVDLVVVGPEAPLVAGVVDRLAEAGIKAFGPSAAAARLEGSKAFTKELCARHDIPTAGFRRCRSGAEGHAAVEVFSAPVVIKADGLAAGKGVTVAMTLEEAHAAVDDVFSGGFGEAGAEAVVEEFMAGEEASLFALCDGTTALVFGDAQDHKRAYDGDEGPNTGGMGAYSPAPIVTPALHARVMREIIDPTVRGMASDGITFTGFLYAGLMIDEQGNPKTLEFNCRMGDPETQPILARLKTDFLGVLEHAVGGTLDQVELEWDRRTALGVVMAAAGYPEAPKKGDTISGIPAESADCVTFHAGTALAEGKLTTAGGRVLCVVGLGDSVKMAQNRAYAATDMIHFQGAQYRRDIGWRALKKHG